VEKCVEEFGFMMVENIKAKMKRHFLDIDYYDIIKNTISQII
jgi:hypothetical protein